MMTFFNDFRKKYPVFFWAMWGWLLFNLVQAWFTPLLHDEAYYWVFSRNLSPAYFDQMPLIAVFIKAGYFFFPNEFGVRLFLVVLQPFTLFILFILTEKRSVSLFLFLAFSQLGLNLMGIFTSPDSLLTFFGALFWLALRNFHRKGGGIREGIWLGMAAGFVGLCKYQGLLLILIAGGVLVPQYGRKAGLYLAWGITLAMILPFLLWSPEVVRESLTYHLAHRGGSGSSLFYFGNFLGSQFLVLGPLVSIFILAGWVLHRPSSPFLKTLKRISLLYFLFLLLDSLKTNVEANWSAPVVGVMLVLATDFWTEKGQSARWIQWASVLSFVGIGVLRLYLIWDFLPEPWARKMRPELHGWKEWAKEVEKVCGDSPVVFWNSYQYPSKYWFYSGHPATCVSNVGYRRNQFDLLPMEADWQGSAVWLAAGFPFARESKEVPLPSGGTLFLKYLAHFFSYPDVWIRGNPISSRLHRDEKGEMEVAVFSKSGKPIHLRSPNELPVLISWTFFSYQSRSFIGTDPEDLEGTTVQDTLRKKIVVQAPSLPGSYFLYFGISAGGYELAQNSRGISVEVY